MLSFQINIVAATSSFASHPWGHNTFFLIVGVTTMPRVWPPSLLEKRAEALRFQRMEFGGLQMFLPALTPGLRGEQFELPGSTGGLGEGPTPNTAPSWEQPITIFSYLLSLLNCGFRCLLNGPLPPQVLLITSESSLSWTAAKAESKALD